MSAENEWEIAMAASRVAQAHMAAVIEQGGLKPGNGKKIYAMLLEHVKTCHGC